MSALVRLQCGPLHLELAPDIGGAIARFYSTQGGQTTHWFRPASEQALTNRDVTGMACFPMLPFRGRIRDGRFTTDHKTIQLPLLPGHSHHLHGEGWLRPWQVVRHSQNEVTLQLEAGTERWPWPFYAEQHLRLNESGLHHTLSVTHAGRRRRPYGIGLHPYFGRTPGCRIRTGVQGMWKADGDVLPTEPLQGKLQDKLALGLDPNTQMLDNTCFGWAHATMVDWGSHTLAIYSGAPADLFAIYTPPGVDYFCLEPCTQVPDFPNLHGFEQALTGGHWLEPGERLELGCWFNVIQRQPARTPGLYAFSYP